MVFTIRKCIDADIGTVRLLQEKWNSENNTYGFIAGDVDYLRKKIGEYFYLAEMQGDIIGFVYGSPQEAKDLAVFADGTKYIEIDDIYIREDCRGLGVGGLLLDTILNAAIENGIERSLIYSAAKDMDKVLGFYRGHSFHTWCIQMYR